LRYFILIGLIGFLFLSIPAHAQETAGRATVIDGDTIEIGGTRIRLHGIDAPESRQMCLNTARKEYRCGQRAAFALADKIGSATVSCRRTDKDRYGRIVAICTSRGVDISQWMARQGWAVAYRQFSEAYVPDETAARRARVGIWAGTFVPPSAWRRGQR